MLNQIISTNDRVEYFENEVDSLKRLVLAYELMSPMLSKVKAREILTSIRMMHSALIEEGELLKLKISNKLN